MSDFRTLILALAILVPAASSASPDENILVVRASGFRHTRGHAIAKLFQPGDDVFRQGRWQHSATIQDGWAEFQFPGLPGGSYAVVVFHDENGNGEIDHNALGLPKEPLGFSNGFSLGLFSGKPTFETLRFEYTGVTQYIKVSMK